eukprot:227997-Chlamydomonas_euryale.AAC.1
MTSACNPNETAATHSKSCKGVPQETANAAAKRMSTPDHSDPMRKTSNDLGALAAGDVRRY